MNFEIEGTLHKIYDAENKSASFQTREFVIMTEGTYPQYVKFQLTQDKCGAIDGYKETDKIKVSFDLRGREWQGKYFTNLNAWRIERAAGQAQSNAPSSTNSNVPPSGFAPFNPEESTSSVDFDDLPF